jgi:adenylate cyclase class 1
LIAQRVNRFLQTLRTAHGRIDSESSSIVTARLGDKLFDVTLDDNGASYRTHATLASLTRALGEQSPRFKQVWFDPACAPESPLQFIYQRNQRGKIQVYAWPRRDRIDVFVVDRDGSLVSYVHQDPDPHVLFSHLHQFFENAQRHSPAFDGEPAGSLQTVEFAIVQTRSAQEFSALAVPAPTATRRHYLPLRLYVDLDAHGKTQFSAYLEDQEFSSGEHGVAFFDAIAVSVRSRRVSRGHYPVFITDLELSDRLLRERGLEPRHLLELLRQKLRIERQLSQALLKVKPDGHA